MVGVAIPRGPFVQVSVVTVVKDNAAGLSRTHKSLLEQTYINWEMIIIVGKSRDDTLLIAKELQGKDLRIRVFEQVGTGIYNAMNEGLEFAIGEFTWFMNSGDKFATLVVLAQAVDEISQSGAGLVVGGYQIESGSGQQIYSFPSGAITQLDFAFNRRGGCHQAMIFRTQILRILHGFDDTYSLAADFDLVMKVIRKSVAKRVSEVYATIEPGGLADQEIFSVHKQKHEIRRTHLGGGVFTIASGAWTMLARMKIITRKVCKTKTQGASHL